MCFLSWHAVPPLKPSKTSMLSPFNYSKKIPLLQHLYPTWCKGGVIYEMKTVGVKISDDQELTCGLSGVYEMSLSSGSACIKELPVSQQHVPAFPAQMMERTSKSFARHWDVLLPPGTLRAYGDDMDLGWGSFLLFCPFSVIAKPLA